MFKSLKNFFEKSQSSAVNDSKSIEVILCGLMIEAANTDGNISDEEMKKIHSSLLDVFKIDPKEASQYIEIAKENFDQSKSLYFYTSQINKNYSDEQKLILLEILWEIILIDGKIHDFESNMIRRLAGLLYISDVKSGIAKSRALNKINKSSNNI
ncbi:MAG: hypothetical protein CMI96_00280 [Pelagibacteraceae bacterium]|nr:hypothetical protein [Pelagibacteraceae bacterium]